MSAARLQTLLGLEDDELLQILGSDPIAVITGEEDLRPEIRILLQLLGDDPPPRAWLRAAHRARCNGSCSRTSAASRTRSRSTASAAS